MVVALAWICVGLAAGIAAESLRHVRLLKDLDQLQTHRTTAEKLNRENTALYSKIASLTADLASRTDTPAVVPETAAAEPEAKPDAKGSVPIDQVPSKSTIGSATTFDGAQAISLPKFGEVQGGVDATSERMPWDTDELITVHSQPSSEPNPVVEPESANIPMPWDVSAQDSPQSALAESKAPAPANPPQPVPTSQVEKMPWDI